MIRETSEETMRKEFELFSECSLSLSIELHKMREELIDGGAACYLRFADPRVE